MSFSKSGVLWYVIKNYIYYPFLGDLTVFWETSGRPLGDLNVVFTMLSAILGDLGDLKRNYGKKIVACILFL